TVFTSTRPLQMHLPICGPSVTEPLLPQLRLGICMQIPEHITFALPLPFPLHPETVPLHCATVFTLPLRCHLSAMRSFLITHHPAMLTAFTFIQPQIMWEQPISGHLV